MKVSKKLTKPLSNISLIILKLQIEQILQEEHIGMPSSTPDIECEQQLPLDATIEEANQCMMRTSIQPLATMDQFVNIKKIKVEQPDPLEENMLILKQNAIKGRLKKKKG